MRLLPQHNQHYPDQLLPHRIEEYVFDDGTAPTQNRAFARRVTGPEVLMAVLAAQATTGLSNIDPRYYVGTCFHEAGCPNEWDTEVATASCPPGFVSVGAFQIGQEEAERFGFKLEDMLDLEKSSECMVRLAEANRKAIRAAAKLADSAPDPDYGTWVGGSMRAYLAAAHNHGVGFIRQAVANWGIDWAKYKAARPTDNIVAHGYGEDCITGGYYWPSVTTGTNPQGGTSTVMNDHSAKLGDRVLLLTDPWMTGEDVRELQRHLKLAPDGTFGTETDKAVRTFQTARGLLDDGKVGPKTVTVLLATT